MTYKKKLGVILISIAVLIFIVGFIMKDVFLLPGFYKNNNEFGSEANSEIMSLILSSIKDRHSSLLKADKDEIYEESLALEQKQAEQDEKINVRFFFIDIDDDFMDTLEKEGNEYSVRVDLNFPDDWVYYYTIKENDGKYLISDFEIDP